MKHFLQSCQTYFKNKHFKVNYIFLLLIFSLVFSLNLPLRYELPRHDEALYSRAALNNFGWSPVYILLYKLLNLFTNDRMINYYLIFYFLDVIAIPILAYKILNKLWNNPQVSFLVCISFVISRLNFEITPKIHHFNFLFLMTILYLKIKFTNFKWLNAFLYLLLAISLYIRSDNIIIFLSILSYHLWLVRKDKVKIIFEVKSLIPALIFSVAIFFLWGPAIHPVRNWNAFLDHYYWIYYQGNFAVHKITFQQMTQIEFANIHSLSDLIVSNPLKILTHSSQNIKKLFFNVFFYFKTTEHTYWYFNASYFIMYFNISLAIFINAFCNEHDRSGETSMDVKRYIILFFCAMMARSFATSILLQPQDKYIFDFCFGFLILLITMAKLVRIQIINKHYAKVLTVFAAIFTLLLFRYPTESSSYQYKTKLVLEFIKASIIDKRIKTILYNSEILAWSKFNLNEFQLSNPLVQEQIKGDLSKFLTEKKIDLIVYDSSLKIYARDAGLIDLYEFNKNHEKYGYEVYLKLENLEICFYTKKAI